MSDFKITDKSGIKLKTANTYVTEDLGVTLTDNDINNIVPENIAKDVTILGVVGTFEGNPKPEQSKTVEFNPGNANNITVTPDTGYVLSSAQVNKPATMIPENIKKDVNIGGVIGTLESGSFDSTKYCRVLYNSNYPLLKGMMIQGGLSNLSNYVKATLTFSTATNHTATQIKALNFFSDIPVLVKDNYVLVDILRQIYGIGDTINVNNTEVLSIGIFLDFSCVDKKYKPAIIKYSTSTGLEWVSWYNNEEVWMYGAFSNSYSQYNCLCVSLLCANSALSKYTAGRSTNESTTLPVSKCYSLAIITDTSSPQCLIKVKDMILSDNYKHLQSNTSGFSYTTINYTLDDINEINI